MISMVRFPVLPILLALCGALAASAQSPAPSAPPPSIAAPAPPSAGTGPAGAFRPAEFPPHEYGWEALDPLVIQNGGRKKPFLTFALEVTREVTGRARVTLPDGRRVSARAFVGSMMLGQPGWADQPVVLLDYNPLKDALGLPRGEKRFSFNALVGNPALAGLVQQVRMLRAAQGEQARLDALQKQVDMLGTRLDLMNALLQGSIYTFVPHPTEALGTWVTVTEIGQLYPPERLGAFNAALVHLVVAFHEGSGVGPFTAAAGELVAAQRALAPTVLPDAGRVALELTYDGLHPFRWAWILYFTATLVFALTWKHGRRAGAWVGWSLVAAGLGFHVFGFVTRILISGRAPVTNMYETMVWVSLAVLLFAIWFEARYRSRYFIAVAGPVAMLFMILADGFPVVFSPSLNPLTAVLRDNFWLTTHVLTVTTSYAAFALAMGIAHVPLVAQLFRRGPVAISKDVYAYIYWTMAVGLCLLIPGIILGGVWANYSWGRFWGWDPKETWALIAAMLYLAILHGRLAGWWTGFGFAVGAVVGFLGVIMAWYGVNFVIGAGLHSYGFGVGGQQYVAAFVIFEVLLCAVATWRYLQKGGQPKVLGSASTA